MKKVVFFFINPGHICLLSGNSITLDQLPSTENYFVKSQNSYTKYHTLKKIDFNDIEDESLIIVKDDFEISEIEVKLKEYYNHTKQMEVFAVYHKNATNKEKVLYYDNFFKSVIGKSFQISICENELRGSLYDRYLIPLFNQFTSKLFNELLLKLQDKILEEKLNILHQCLVPGDIKEDLLKDTILDESCQQAYKIFWDSVKGISDDDSFNLNYINALKQLRNAFLELR